MIPTEDLMDLLISRCGNLFSVNGSAKACSFYIKNRHSVDVYFLNPDRPGGRFMVMKIDRDSIIHLMKSPDSMIWNHGDTISAKLVW